jgi:hypothetical protein
MAWEDRSMSDALTIMREALERIENPVKWEVEHVPEGYDINGAMVISMTEKAPYYQQVAREALQAVAALGAGEKQ